MIDGSMQHFPLTLDRILDHAAKWHGDVEVATAGEDAHLPRKLGGARSWKPLDR